MEDLMSVDQNKLAFRSIPERLFNTGDLSLVPELFNEDYIEHAPIPPGFPRGLEMIREWTRQLRTAFPDYLATVENVVGEGDTVAGRIRCRGTHLGSYFGIPATGKVIEWTESHFGRMENGKLAEHWTDFDQFGMFQQMGLIPEQNVDAAAPAATAPLAQ
jgi:steroid delta-isomerase-like uncharacterized protein